MVCGALRGGTALAARRARLTLAGDAYLAGLTLAVRGAARAAPEACATHLVRDAIPRLPGVLPRRTVDVAVAPDAALGVRGAEGGTEAPHDLALLTHRTARALP